MQYRIFIIFVLLFSFACKKEKKSERKTESKAIVKHNQLTDAEKAEGWDLLFDGKTKEGWHLYNFQDSTSVWIVENGTLYCKSKEGSGRHGDLVTDREFENYELRFEWKLAEEGNSGIFINVQEQPDKPATWHTAPEYQLLDSKHMDYAIDNTKHSGCLYSFSPQSNVVDAKPAGQWNTSVIKQMNGKIEFYLNGIQTAEADFNSEEWKEWIKTSNFKVFPDFGLATKGRIGLQDWFSDVWFRNIKVKTL
ncbi:MAG: 3-keto-disaccharide hydrolase [Flavobacteriaceae bacterium]